MGNLLLGILQKTIKTVVQKQRKRSTLSVQKQKTIMQLMLTYSIGKLGPAPWKTVWTAHLWNFQNENLRCLGPVSRKSR